MIMAAKRTVQIVPSLLAADFSRLGEAVRRVKDAGVTWVSVDVMDGHFVPNLSFGPDHVRAVKREAPIMVDAHLMVSNPEQAAPWFIAAGADIVTVHLEACRDPRALLASIRKAGVKAGLAIKPATPVGGLLALLDLVDLALVMTVEPGFGGAKFLADMLPKVSALRAEIDRRGLDCWIQVDGGINLSTIASAAAAGADSLVAGSAVYGAADIAAAVKALRDKAQLSFESR